MLLFVIKNREPIHKDLVTPQLDYSWLHAMGYLYETGKFLHTCEHQIKENLA